MNNFFDISKKIPNTPLRFIVLLMVVASGCIGFRFLMETGLLDTIWGKALFLAILLIIFLILFTVEHKYLLRKTELNLTKEELNFYLKVNYLITFLVFIIFAFILFLF